jgi:hypothetical protein
MIHLNVLTDCADESTRKTFPLIANRGSSCPYSIRTSQSHTYRLSEPSSTAYTLQIHSFQTSGLSTVHTLSVSVCLRYHTCLACERGSFHIESILPSCQHKHREALFRTPTDATPTLRHWHPGHGVLYPAFPGFSESFLSKLPKRLSGFPGHPGLRHTHVLTGAHAHVDVI